MDDPSGRLAGVKTLLSVRELSGSIIRSVKLVAVFPTAQPCCDVYLLPRHFVVQMDSATRYML